MTRGWDGSPTGSTSMRRSESSFAIIGELPRSGMMPPRWTAFLACTTTGDDFYSINTISSHFFLAPPQVATLTSRPTWDGFRHIGRHLFLAPPQVATLIQHDLHASDCEPQYRLLLLAEFACGPRLHAPVVIRGG